MLTSFGAELNMGRFLKRNRTQHFCNQPNPRKFLPDPPQPISDTRQFKNVSW